VGRDFYNGTIMIGGHFIRSQVDMYFNEFLIAGCSCIIRYSFTIMIGGQFLNQEAWEIFLFEFWRKN
jgi:hypothetical protein